MTPKVPAKRLSEFDPKTFLSTINGGRKIAAFPKKQTIFAQGDSSNAVFYIKEGKVRLTVVSKIGNPSLKKRLAVDDRILSSTRDAKWISFELQSGDDLPDAIRWFTRAYRLTAKTDKAR